jgi:hypothetical protein
MRSWGVPVVPLHPQATALATDVARKLLHDVHNSLVSVQAVAELAALDWPECADAVAPIRAHLDSSLSQMRRPLRTLPSRSAQRPRTMALWQAQLPAQTAPWLQAELIAADLPVPRLAEADWVQCLDNVVQNAVDAAKALAAGAPLEVGQTALRLHAAALQGQGYAGVELCDACGGCDDLEAVAAGKRCRGGMGHVGLGLAVAAAHLHSVGGAVLLRQLASPPGLCVTLWWPV